MINTSRAKLAVPKLTFFFFLEKKRKLTHKKVFGSDLQNEKRTKKIKIELAELFDF